MDMYTHLRLWWEYLERCLARKLDQKEDFIFPYLAPNSIIHADMCMSTKYFQALLDEFTWGAGLMKHYTTHCFRRGGAQYRFMFAPIGQRWSLNMIRWWGGWASGEKVMCTAL